MPLQNYTIFLNNQTLYTQSAGFSFNLASPLYVPFDTSNYPDGTYNLTISITLANGIQLTSTSQILIQNHDPLLMELGATTLGILAIIFILQRYQSRKKSIVAAVQATQGKGKVGKTTSSQVSTSTPKTSPAATITTTKQSVPRPGPGWRVILALAVLFAITVWYTIWLNQIPPENVDFLFSNATLYPILLIATEVSAGLALLCLFLAKYTIAKVIAGIIYTAVILGSALAIGFLGLAAFLQSTQQVALLAGWPGDEATLGSVTGIAATMLSWIISGPVPAAVNAVRFAKYRRVTPPQVTVAS
jgi:hypothetical protein